MIRSGDSPVIVHIGVGDTPQEAVRAALMALGEPYATEMADRIEVQPRSPQEG